MSAAPGRRQSTRQVTRTSRPHNYYARGSTGRGLAEAPSGSNQTQPGFFPAITHFTDAVDTLPREVVRHFSMLKEVEAKLHAPDELLRHLADAITHLPPPTRNQPPPPAYFPSAHNSVNGSRNGSIVGTQQSDTSSATEVADRARQSLFHQLNFTIQSMAPALDEKIAVLSTANQTLQRQLDRMTSSYVHIPEEVSDEARLGNPKHWAYVTDKETKKAPERTRRDVTNANANTLAAAAAAMHAADGEIASRSETRREAVAAKKSRAAQVDSDFDDRPPPKKGPGKAKKPVESANHVGLGIQNGVAGPSKRRKVAAAAAATAAPMERSISGVFPSNTRGNQASPRETPDIVPKKRAKPGPAPKKRIAGAASPQVASSPVVGTFSIKESTIRPNNNRARQHSATTSIQSAAVDMAKNRPPSQQSQRATNGMPILSAYEQLQAVAAAGEGSELLKPLPEQARRLKSEEPEVVDDVSMPDAEVPAPVVVTTTRAGRASKTATPMSSTFPDLGPRNRSIRTKDQAGSHASSESGERTRRKKGAGSAAASLRAENDNVADEVSDANEGDEAELEDLDPEEIADVEDVEEEGNEPKYCYCNDVSYGEMVACDNENCAKEWFHLKCAGLSRAPDENIKWYCTDCKAAMLLKRSRPSSRRE